MALAAAGFPSIAGAQLSFSDQTGSAGLTYTHTPDPGHPMDPMYAGGTVGDFNSDGWPDIFVLGGGSPDKLFINNGDGTFSDQAPAWGLTHLYYGCGAIAGDYNKDGWQDIYVTSFGDVGSPPQPGLCRLYRNNGNKTFTEVAAAAGVEYLSPMPAGQGAAFGDYDMDGLLDLYVTAWMSLSDGNRLFHNNGDGTFSDVTVAAGVEDTSIRGFTPRFADMNGDRYPELLVAADYLSSRYFVNNRDGTFTDQTASSGTGLDDNGMGAAIADLDNDGLLDWFVSAIYHPNPGGGGFSGNRLYWCQGNDVFAEGANAAGVRDGGWAWGVTAVDLDNDGWVDLAGTNGWPAPSIWQADPTWIFHNDGGRSFTEVAQASGLVHTGQGRGLYHLDYDGDGDMDLLILSFEEPLKLFRNDLSGPGTHWLQVDLDTSQHKGLPPNGMGSRLELTAGGRSWVAYVDGGPTYLGRSQYTCQFGLGPATMVDRLQVEWPDGFVTVLENVPADQRITVSATQPFQHDLLVRGALAEFKLTGARPGETAWFLTSLAGQGAGPCPPSLGGMCIDLLAPIRIVGSAVADASGLARLSFVVPPGAPLAIISSQAVVPRGPGGIHSAKSNLRTGPILP